MTGRTYQVYVTNSKTGDKTLLGNADTHMTHGEAVTFKRAHETGYYAHLSYALVDTTND